MSRRFGGRSWISIGILNHRNTSTASHDLPPAFDEASATEHNGCFAAAYERHCCSGPERPQRDRESLAHSNRSHSKTGADYSGSASAVLLQ